MHSNYDYFNVFSDVTLYIPHIDKVKPTCMGLDLSFDLPLLFASQNFV